MIDPRSRRRVTPTGTRFLGETLAAALAHQAERRADGVALRFIEPGGDSLATSTVTVLSFDALARRAASVAASLRDRGAPGDRALLLCPPGA